MSLCPHVDACGLAHGKYLYTDDLLALEQIGGAVPEGVTHIQAHIIPVHGFLPLERWDQYLHLHPDQVFAAFLRRGIQSGFRIGFDRSKRLSNCTNNHQSVKDNKMVVESYVMREVANSKLSPSAMKGIHCSPIGIIPKPHQPGKYRLIVDLSAPQCSSINDGVPTELCSLHYASVEQAVELVKLCGPGALMAKLDLQSAYRMVPVHPQDQSLLGIEWDSRIYIDKALPFGLRSAQKLFTAVADALAWAMICNGLSSFLHYLDDFFFCAPKVSTRCQDALGIAVPLCLQLGLPVAPQKVEGPCSVLTFMQTRATTTEWSAKRSVTKQQLQGLIGHLNFAAKVVKPGRLFTRELFNTMTIPKRSFHLVRLNSACRADIAWWSLFLKDWNGISFFPTFPQGITVVSDASGKWGCGAFVKESLHWFQVQWPEDWEKVNIAVKELIPIVVSAAIWGKSWSRTRIKILSDNMAVVHALSSFKAPKDPHLAHLVRCLFFFSAHYGFEHDARHILGKDNQGADALSRDNSSNFLSIFPQAQLLPDAIPPTLLTLLFDPKLTWTSTVWKGLFQDILAKVSRHPQ